MAVVCEKELIAYSAYKAMHHCMALLGGSINGNVQGKTRWSRVFNLSTLKIDLSIVHTTVDLALDTFNGSKKP